MTPSVRRFLSRLTGLVRRRSIDAELRQEIASHLDEACEEYIRQGLSPQDARSAALRSFGGVVQIEEEYRDRASFRPIEDLWRDLRYGLRSLRHAVGFSVAVLAVLSIGIGGMATVFTLLNRIVFQPLPYPSADRIVVLKHAAPGLGLPEVGLSSGLYFHYLEHARSLEGLGVYTTTASTFRGDSATAERVELTYTSSGVFSVLGVPPAIGRLFTEDDGASGFMNMTWAVPVLLSHEFWFDHFGHDPAVVGRLIVIGDRTRRVVGVMPEGFAFPNHRTQIWMMLEPPRSTANFASVFNWNAVAKLRPGVAPFAAETDLRSVMPRIIGAYHDATPERFAEARLNPRVIPLKSVVIADIEHVLWTLFAGMFVLLIIAWTNASALFAVRADQRDRETAVRLALGAHRHQVIRMFIVEAMVLTVGATFFGILIARGLIAAAISTVPELLPRASEVRIGGVEIGFLTFVATGLGLFYGFAPSYRGIRRPTVSLAGSGQRVIDNRRSWLGIDPMIALQVTLALTLMVGSALMLQTYRNLSNSRLGFAADHLVTIQLNLPGSKANQHVRIYNAIADRIARQPNVESASLASFVPLTQSEHTYPVLSGASPIPFKFFTPGYFQTMQVRVVEGQSLARGEQSSVAFPVLVSRALARRLYPGATAIGRPIRRLNEDGSIVTLGLKGPVPAFVIAGIVDDVREVSLREPPTELVYVPLLDPPVEQSIVPTSMMLVVRVRVDPSQLMPSIRDAIRQVDSTLSVGRVQAMETIVKNARSREAFVGFLLSLAAAASMFLGTIGIYGNVSQVVKRRTREIGIRLTLGARPIEVVRMAAADQLRTLVAGATTGLFVAFAAARTLRSLLFGVDPGEPAILALVLIAICAAGVAAALLAASRAARIDPASALRVE
jgi:putative ABC transport system permease protein